MLFFYFKATFLCLKSYYGLLGSVVNILLLVLFQALFDEIQARNAEFMKRWASGDMESLSKLYAEDCKLMPTGCDTLVGRQGILIHFFPHWEICHKKTSLYYTF